MDDDRDDEEDADADDDVLGAFDDFNLLHLSVFYDWI